MKTNKDEPRLRKTKTYSMFEGHEHNRPQREDTLLLESMQERGFMPSSPVQCVRNGNGKLKIIRGHHRVHYAERLGLPVYYVIDESNTDIFHLEGSCRQTWSASDFAFARAQAGDRDCADLLAFRKKHGLTIGSAASLVGGECAGSTNKIKAIKSGRFRKGDMKHANKVVAITDRLRDLGVSFATSTAFVKAVSMAVFTPEVDYDRLAHRLETHSDKLQKRGSSDEYLEELESAYNFQNRSQRVPLKFLSKESAANRQKTFGGRNKVVD